MASAGYTWNDIFNLTESVLFHTFHRKVLITASCTSGQTFTSAPSNVFILSEAVVRKLKLSAFHSSRNDVLKCGSLTAYHC